MCPRTGRFQSFPVVLKSYLPTRILNLDFDMVSQKWLYLPLIIIVRFEKCLIWHTQGSKPVQSDGQGLVYTGPQAFKLVSDGRPGSILHTDVVLLVICSNTMRT